jgi:hypothetical protein
MRQYKNTQYYITEGGDVFNKQNNKKSHQISNSGYKMVNLQIDGKPKMCSIHRLVAQTYLNNPNNLPIVNHINGIKTDNRVNNLEWTTRQENEKHAVDSKLKASGEKHGMSKLKENDVNWIRKNYKPRDVEFGRKAMSEKLKVTPQLITAIINYKIWK